MASKGDVIANLSLPKMDFHEISALADQFVLQYYSVMNKCPELLHRFYSDDSALIYESAPISGQQEIFNAFNELNFQDTRVLIHKVDALRANINTVLIQVCGEISIARAVPRRFMQSFTLCEKSSSDFYVLNDIFRYQDRVYIPAVAEPEAKQTISAEPNEVPLAVEPAVEVPNSNGVQQGQSWQTPPQIAPISKPVIEQEPESAPVESEPVVSPVVAELVKEPEIQHPAPTSKQITPASPSPPAAQPVSTCMSWAERVQASRPVSTAHPEPQNIQQPVKAHAPPRGPVPPNRPYVRFVDKVISRSRPRLHTNESAGSTGDQQDARFHGPPGGRPSGPPRGGRGRGGLSTRGGGGGPSGSLQNTGVNSSNPRRR